MHQLAAQQDSSSAAQMAEISFEVLDADTVSRGRVDYHRFGALRTKPGRADSPPTACMSCSDKIALWSVCGIQGALGSALLDPVYVQRVVIGDVQPELWANVYEDCDRAFRQRVAAAIDLDCEYTLDNMGCTDCGPQVLSHRMH